MNRESTRVGYLVVKPSASPKRNSTEKVASSPPRLPSVNKEKVVPHYLRASTGSCHDFCKYGVKHSSESETRRPFLRRKSISSAPSGRKDVENLSNPDKIKKLSSRHDASSPEKSTRDKSVKTDNLRVQTCATAASKDADAIEDIKRTIYVNGCDLSEESAGISVNGALSPREISIHSDDTVVSESESPTSAVHDVHVIEENVTVEQMVEVQSPIKEAATTLPKTMENEMPCFEATKPPMVSRGVEEDHLAVQTASIKPRVRQETSSRTPAFCKHKGVKPMVLSLKRSNSLVKASTSLRAVAKTARLTTPVRKSTSPSKLSARFNTTTPLNSRPTSNLKRELDVTPTLKPNSLSDTPRRSSATPSGKPPRPPLIPPGGRNATLLEISKSPQNPPTGLNRTPGKPKSPPSLVTGLVRRTTVEKANKSMVSLKTKGRKTSVAPMQGAEKEGPRSKLIKLGSLKRTTSLKKKVEKSINDEKSTWSNASSRRSGKSPASRRSLSSRSSLSSRDANELLGGIDLTKNFNSRKRTTKVRSSPNQEKEPAPYKLKFRRGKVVNIQSESRDVPTRLMFRLRKVIGRSPSGSGDVQRNQRRRDCANPENEASLTTQAGNVVLRHQNPEDRKDNPSLLLNKMIEETASKLVEKKKSKVKALVGAFETVISLQEGKSI